jgi:hypothetical protein
MFQYINAACCLATTHSQVTPFRLDSDMWPPLWLLPPKDHTE